MLCTYNFNYRFKKEKIMNILLVRPQPPKETIGLQHVMICEPLELEYLAGNLPQDFNVEILDMILEKKSLEFFVNKFQPDMVGITGYITHIGVMKEYSDIIRDRVVCSGVLSF